jgi:hypothetical protein
MNCLDADLGIMKCKGHGKYPNTQLFYCEGTRVVTLNHQITLLALSLLSQRARKKELNDWSLNNQPRTKRDGNEGQSPVCNHTNKGLGSDRNIVSFICLHKDVPMNAIEEIIVLCAYVVRL